MDEQGSQELLLLVMAIEAVVSALAKRAGADPAFSGQVTMAVVATTAGLDASVAARVNALARKITGER